MGRRSSWLSAVKKAFLINHRSSKPKDDDQLQQKQKQLKTSQKNQQPQHSRYSNDNVSEPHVPDYYYYCYNQHYGRSNSRQFVDGADHRMNDTASRQQAVLQQEKPPDVKEEEEEEEEWESTVMKNSKWTSRNGIWRLSGVSSKKKYSCRGGLGRAAAAAAAAGGKMKVAGADARDDEKDENCGGDDHHQQNEIDDEMWRRRRRRGSGIEAAAPESSGGACGIRREAVTTTTRRRRSESQQQKSARRAMAVAAATAAAAEAAAAAAQAAAAVATLSSSSSARPPPPPTRISSSSSAAAAIRIQAAFRGYLVRRDMAAWRSMARLQRMQKSSRTNLVGTRSSAVLHSAATTARYAPSLQDCSQYSERSEAGSMITMTAKTKTKPNSKKQHRSWREGRWDDRTLTVEEIEEREMARQEATMKRERAMAYSLSHQRIRKERGWNWLERWMAARPWEREHRRESSLVTTSRMIPESVLRQPQPRRQRQLAFVEESPTPSLASYRTSIPATPRREVGIASSITSPNIGRYGVPLYGSAWSVASTPNYMVPTQSARAKFRCHSTPRCRPSTRATTQHGGDEVVPRFSKAAFFI